MAGRSATPATRLSTLLVAPLPHSSPATESLLPAMSERLRERLRGRGERERWESMTGGSNSFLKTKILTGLSRVRHVGQYRFVMGRGGLFVRYR